MTDPLPWPITSIVTELGESPLWHDNAMHWVDLRAGAVHHHVPRTGATRTDHYPDTVSFIQPEPKAGTCSASADR